MKTQRKRVLSLLLLLTMLLSLAMPSAYALETTEESEPLLASASGVKTPADESPYKSLASIGDSIAAGFGPLMANNGWSKFYYEKPPVGSYPYELTKDLGLSLQDDFNSMLCVDQRLIDVYYAMGGDPDPVVNPDNTDETLSYLEDARIYHSSAYMKVLEDLHDSGEGAARITNSDLITIQIGFADLAVYPLKRTATSDGYDYDKAIDMMQYGIQSYQKYYPKMIKLIQELNPDAKILILSQYNPYEKLVFESSDDENYYKLFAAGISLFNTELKAWCLLYGCTYVDITGLGSYIDNDEIEVAEGEFIPNLINHENHPGAAGHRYVEDQILDALNLARPTKAPTLDDVDYLAFTSDVHNGDSGVPASRLNSWLDNVSEDLGDVTFDYMGICGDLGADNAGSSYGNKAQIVMDVINNNTNVKKGVYTTGNHEYNPGVYHTSSQYAPYSYYTRLGEAADEENYQIYCFGAAHWNYSFDDADIEALAAYMEQADCTKPVFIMSHFPLHVIPTRTMGNWQKVVEVLNNYPNAIFIWGHNHTDSDPHYGIVYSGDLDGVPINFVYCSAGCMSDSEYSKGSGSITVKGLVAAIDGDDDLTLTYYDKEYEPVCSYTVDIIEGTAEEIDVGGEELEPNFDGKIYSKQTDMSEGEYAIAVGNIAMNNVYTEGYWNIDEYGEDYHYTGFKGEKVTLRSGKITAGLTADQLWVVEKVSNGYTIKNKETGQYLTGYYTSKVGGDIVLEDTAKGDNSVWTYSSSNLKNVGTGKQLNFEVESDVSGTLTDGEANLFDLRTNASDTVCIYRAKISGTDENSDYYSVSSLEDGKWYIITAENKALTSSYHSGYVNRNSNDATYKYTGLAGTAVTVNGNSITSKVTADMLWQAVKVSGGFALRNCEGKYLNETYSTSESDYTGVGALFVADSAEAWAFSGTTLVGNNTSKGLNYQSQSDIDGTKLSGSMDFFTCRTESRDEVKIYISVNGLNESVDPNEVLDTDNEIADTEIIPNDYELITSSTLLDGMQVVFAAGSTFMTTESDEGYKNKDNSSKYYYYSGLDTGALSVEAGGSTLPADTENMVVWTVEVVSGGYRFKTSDGKYLSASYDGSKSQYYSEGNAYTGVGKVYLTDTPDNNSVWTFENSSGNITLKNVGCDKILTRNYNGDVTGTILNPAEKSMVDFYTVRSSRTHSLYMYQKFTVKHALVTSGELKDGATVVFAYDKYYMGSNRGVGFKHLSSNGSYYLYSGLSANNLGATAGTSLATLPVVTEAMVWTVEKVSGGYRFKNANDRYLGLYYATGVPFDFEYEGVYSTVTSSGTNMLTLYAEPDDSCVWKVSFSDGKASVINAKYTSRYLTYNDKAKTSGTIYEPTNPDNISLFTVRSSSSYPLYIYQEHKNTVTVIEDGAQYILTYDGFAMSSNEGNGYRDTNSDYWYDGRDAIAVESSGNKLNAKITNDMVWTFEKNGDGYYIKSADGQYLNSKYYGTKTDWVVRGNINLYLSDTPELWTYTDGVLKGATSGKQISYQTNGGETSVFTLRSSTNHKFTLYKLTDTGTCTALYSSTAGGTVSRTREVYNKGDDFTYLGSVATANAGYHFVGWYKGDQLLTEEAQYIPAGSGAYIARFAENIATLRYKVMINGEGDSTVPVLSCYEEALGAVTDSANGSTANKTLGYTFMYWTSDAAGERTVSKNSTYTPKQMNGAYSDATYYAWYQKELICYRTETTQLSEVTSGNHGLFINGGDCGKFVFTQVDDGWTIYSVADKKYVCINSDGAFALSSVAISWSYSSKGFSTKASVKLLGFIPITRTYYLVANNGALATSSSAASSTVLVDYYQIGYTSHSYTYTCNGDGTHTGTCSVCGHKIQGNCSYDENGICTVCKGINPAKAAVTGVKVSVTSEKVYANILKRLFNKYTTQYNVTITPEVNGVTVSSVSYKTSAGGQYTPGTSFTSTSEVKELWIKVIDSNNAESIWHYTGSGTIRES